MYLFSFFWMFVVILPVIVPFFLDRGLTMHQVFQLQAIFGMGVVLLEIPTGYLSDIIGRKKTLVLGAFISGLAFTYLSFAQNFWQLVIFELTLSLALSLVSGADISMLYDSVDKSHRKHGTNSLANLQLASVSGESVASVLGGILIAWSFQHVLYANAIAGWIPFLIALSIKEPKYEKMNTESHWKNFLQVFRHIFSRTDRILFLSFLNLTVWGLSTFFAVWMAQKYWQENGISLTYFGAIWAALNLSVGIAGKQVHRLEQRFGPIPLLVFIGIAPILAYSGMGFFEGVLGVAMGLFFYLSRGVNSVLLKDALNWRTPSSFRATANSLQSFFFRLGFAICGPGVGFLIDRAGMRFTLKLLAAVFVLFFYFTMLPLIREIRKVAPDYIPERRG